MCIRMYMRIRACTYLCVHRHALNIGRRGEKKKKKAKVESRRRRRRRRHATVAVSRLLFPIPLVADTIFHNRRYFSSSSTSRRVERPKIGSKLFSLSIYIYTRIYKIYTYTYIYVLYIIEGGGGKVCDVAWSVDRSGVVGGKSTGLSGRSDGAGAASEKLLNECRGSLLRLGSATLLGSLS